MKKFTSAVLVTSFIMGAMQVSHAFENDPNLLSIDGTGYSIGSGFSEASSERLLNNTRILLEKSSVTRKLRDSDNPIDKTRYSEALGLFKKAEVARSLGNFKEADNLAIETARVIARAMPDLHRRLVTTKKI